MRRVSKRKVIEIYNKIENDPDYDLENFLENNDMEIETATFTEEERALLEKYCIQKFLGVPLEDECSICLLQFEVNEDILVYPCCKHRYHQECINIWMETRMTCPLCRGNLRVNLMREIKSQLYAQELKSIEVNPNENDLQRSLI